MARTLELTLASVLALMGGVYLLRSSRAEQARHQAELAAAVARRASLSAALLEARAALETERRRGLLQWTTFAGWSMWCLLPMFCAK